jgi:GR25 family glycosyltransferase involved in LPS biosynthesis
MKTFIVHYTKLSERKKHIDNEISKHNLDAKFITLYDKESISELEYKQFDRTVLNDSKISLIKKHIVAWQEIVELNEISLILEDDTILDDSFVPKLEFYMSQLNDKHFDMVFIGNTCDLHIPDSIVKNSGTNVFLKGNYPTTWGGDGASKCSDSYLITPNCARKIVNYIKNMSIINLPCDFLLNEIIRDNHFTVYWVEPTIVKTGKFSSSLI